MTRPLATLFIIADGAHARWVRRSDHADDFVTQKALSADHESPRAPPGGVGFESSSGRPAAVGKDDDMAERRRLRFAEKVAEAINADVERDEIVRLAIVAPARMINDLSPHLSPPARAKLAKALDRDLTKTPDHELSAWLAPLEIG
jgi:protein required for attachment to host cells